MIFVESSRDACLSFDECYEICFRQNCTFSFALFVHFHLTFTLNNKSTQQIRLITIHSILNDVDMNLLIEKAKQIFIKQNIQISDEQLSEYINYCAQQMVRVCDYFCKLIFL